MRALAEALVRRHVEAARAPDLAPDASEHARTLACQADLLSGSPRAGAAAVAAALERARRFLDTSADRLLARAGAGRILAAAHPLRLADARWGADGEAVIAPGAGAAAVADDAALELAHLSVSLRLRGRASLAERFVSHYAGECEDFDLYPVLDFYEDLCLVERAAAGATPWDPAPRVAPASGSRSGRPLLLVTSGPVASGKSSLARALADRLGAARVVADRVRDHLVHGAPGRALHEAGWAEGFEPGIARRIYAELLRRGELVLASGRAVVLDAAFPTRRERDAARALARRLGVSFRFVECRIDPATQRARLADRDREEGLDGAWEEIARRFDERFVAPDELDPAERVVVSTAGAVDAALGEALDALGRSPAAEDAASPGAIAAGAARSRPLARTPRAVTFDCWRTLLVETDWAAAHARRVAALLDAARSAGLAVEADHARRAFDEAWREHMVAWTRGVATGAPEIARSALAALGWEGERHALEALVAHWQEASHSGRVRAVEGAREALASLSRAGLRCALVCDTGLTPGRVVRQLLEAQGLLEGLGACAFSDEVGVPKPDPQPFRAALASLGVPPEAAAHVGDLRRTDVAGARALGMATIRLRAIYDDPSPLEDADAVADTHDEVLRLLGLAPR